VFSFQSPLQRQYIYSSSVKRIRLFPMFNFVNEVLGSFYGILMTIFIYLVVMPLQVYIGNYAFYGTPSNISPFYFPCSFTVFLFPFCYILHFLLLSSHPAIERKGHCSRFPISKRRLSSLRADLCHRLARMAYQ
jgi:hypothetical protein